MENVTENRLRLAEEHTVDMGLEDLIHLAMNALTILYEDDDDYFQEQWENYIGDEEKS